MGIAEKLTERWAAIVNSPSVLVVPVGDAKRIDRGILSAVSEQTESAPGSFEKAIRHAFSGLVIAAALAAGPVHAGGVGYDANVYGQMQNQVMQQGAATRMTVVDVRPVKIEVAPQASQSGQVIATAIMGTGSAVGAIIGNQMGKSSAGSQQIGTILGGLAGMIGGKMIGNAVQGSQEPAQIDGSEITLVNPTTNQLSVITQAGSQTFNRGDPVLVVMSGGTARVVADRGRSIQNTVSQSSVDVGSQTPLLHGQALENALVGVLRTAKQLGMQVDANKVANLLETGTGERDGVFVGKVAGVDQAHGLVFQQTGRGMGVVLSSSSLSRVPAVGEIATIRVQNGQGLVSDGPGQAVGMGYGR